MNSRGAGYRSSPATVSRKVSTATVDDWVRSGLAMRRAMRPTLGDLPASGLNDLPAHRRDYLLWRNCLDDGVRALDDHLRWASTHPCRVDTQTRRYPRSSPWMEQRTTRAGLGAVRVRLIEALGPRCHACGEGRGILVDHDHFTRLVRGLVALRSQAW